METNNKEILGMISDIQTFSLHDGPGIRTSVFMKGCPLRCVWCHNPETNLGRPQPSRLTSKCVACGRCAEACPNGAISSDLRDVDTDKCTACGTCIRECPKHAISMLGTLKTPREVADAVIRDRIFYEHSGGGVTVTGGEPLLQPEFTYELLSILRNEKIHTAVETCGFANEDVLAKVAGVTDLFLFDYKETDDKLHKEWTGVPQDKIMKNLQLLSKLNAKVVLRCPLIPGLNDRPDHLAGIADVAKQMTNIEYVELMPYHNIGLDKARQIGARQRSDIKVPDREQKLAWKEAVIRAGYDRVEVSLNT